MWILNIIPANAASDLFQGFLVQLDISQLRHVGFSFLFDNAKAFGLCQRHQFFSGFALHGFFKHFFCEFFLLFGMVKSPLTVKCLFTKYIQDRLSKIDSHWNNFLNYNKKPY